MDSQGNIYEADPDKIPAEDKARLEGYLRGREEAAKLAQVELREKMLQEMKKPDPHTPILVRTVINDREFVLYQDKPGIYSFNSRPDGLEVNGRSITQRDLSRGWGLTSDYQPAER